MNKFFKKQSDSELLSTPIFLKNLRLFYIGFLLILLFCGVKENIEKGLNSITYLVFLSQFIGFLFWTSYRHVFMEVKLLNVK